MKFLIIAMLFTGCAGLKVKDLNKIDAGMSKAKVLSELGEPNSKRMDCGKEIFEYQMKGDDGEMRPRVVVFEDSEVTFYGKPSELKPGQCSTSQNDRSSNQNTNTNTVSPHINVNPTIMVGIPQSGQPSRQSVQIRAPAGNGSYFHEIPTANTKEGDQ